MASTESGQAAVKRGLLAERVAARFLRDNGYQILHRNYRSRRGEIDIIAIDHGVLVFVEVRQRSLSSLVCPEESINVHKRQRIAYTAEHYLACHSFNGDCRFDVVCISGDPMRPSCRVELIRSAFELGG